MTAIAASTTAAAGPGAVATRPFSSFEWIVALRYLRGRRARAFVSEIAGFSFLGIGVGVATLIVVMSVMNGFRHELLDKIVGINGHVFLQGIDTPLTDYDAVDARVAAVPGVKLVIPMIEGAAAVSSPYGQTGALIRGVKGADLQKLPGIAGHVTLGSLDDFDTKGGVAIGQRLAESLSVQVGDTVSVLIAKGAQTPFGVAPRIKSYPVTAIFQIGMSEFDSSFVYMPLPEAQTFFARTARRP